MITIATWNVNSVKARLTHLLEWLREDSPDIVLLQELKCIDEAFPAMEIEELGYNIVTHGQKTYNGVAILSKFRLSDITRGLPGEPFPEQSRYIEAVVELPTTQRADNRLQMTSNKDMPKPLPSVIRHPSSVIRVASVYVVNGQEVGSDKFAHKLAFLDTLHAHMKTLLSYGEALVVGGDYNIAPSDLDVHDPAHWHGSVLTHDEVRTRWRKLINAGLYDAFRHCHPSEGGYSWWDYRAGAYAKNDGLRIDHLLLSAHALEKLKDCDVVKKLRALEKASDHAPVIMETIL